MFTTNPLRVGSLEDVLRLSHVYRKTLEMETALNGYIKGCDAACGDCEICGYAKQKAAQVLTHPNSYSWEVYSEDPVDLAGILVLSRVDPGRDASVIFTFFDGKLRDKTEVLQSWFDWSFNTFGLSRLTLEVPAYAFAAMRFAKKLGFGGDFVHEGFHIEGVKRRALTKDSEPVDLVIMGMTNA